MPDRIFYQEGHDYNISGTRHWRDLRGWEQDDYLMACFEGEAKRSLVKESLGLFDRVAMSISQHLLGPFWQYGDDGTSHYHPENLARVSRNRAIRQLVLKDTSLGNRLRAAERRVELTDVERLDEKLYDSDQQLNFTSLDSGQTKGLEMLADDSVGGLSETDYPARRMVNPDWNN